MDACSHAPSDHPPYAGQRDNLVDGAGGRCRSGSLRCARRGLLTAPDGETALEIYRDNADQISLVILDLVMPGMGGRVCLERILEIDAKASVIIASGYAPDDASGPVIAAKARGHIQKPYAMEDLLGSVRRLLDETA